MTDTAGHSSGHYVLKQVWKEIDLSPSASSSSSFVNRQLFFAIFLVFISR